MTVANLAGPAVVSLLRCAVDDLVVGFDLTRTAGVERGDRLRPLPDHPDAVGLIQNRDGEWPVYPLGTWLGLDPEKSDPRKGHVVLVHARHGKFGLAVDRVFPVARVDRGLLLSPPGIVGPIAEWLTAGVVLADSGPLVVLDPHRLDPRAAGDMDLPLPLPAKPVPALAAAGDRFLLVAYSELPSGRTVALGIPVGTVVEVCSPGPGSVVPSSPEHLRELIAWRGSPIALVDASLWAGLSPTPPDPRRAVIIRTGGTRIAIATGPEMRTLPGRTPSIPTRYSNPAVPHRVRGIFDLEDATIVVPDWPMLARNQ